MLGGLRATDMAGRRRTGIRGRARWKVAGAGPRLTIGLPIYNGEQLLPQALESMLTQEFDDFEVVISDNAIPVDRTPELCAAYAAKDRRIRYVRNERNLGSIPNFNKLVGLAKAEYFR